MHRLQKGLKRKSYCQILSKSSQGVKNPTKVQYDFRVSDWSYENHTYRPIFHNLFGWQKRKSY